MKTLAQGVNTAAQDSNPGSLSRESETLPLSHCAVKCLYVCAYIILRACVHACVRACVRACVCICESACCISTAFMYTVNS